MPRPIGRPYVRGDKAPVKLLKLRWLRHKKAWRKYSRDAMAARRKVPALLEKIRKAQRDYMRRKRGTRAENFRQD